jgi:hypothetical protein
MIRFRLEFEKLKCCEITRQRTAVGSTYMYLASYLEKQSIIIITALPLLANVVLWRMVESVKSPSLALCESASGEYVIPVASVSWAASFPNQVAPI